MPWLHKRNLQVVRDELLADHLGRLVHERGNLVDLLPQLFVKQSDNLTRLGRPTDGHQDVKQQIMDLVLDIVATQIGQLLVRQRSPPTGDGLFL